MPAPIRSLMWFRRDLRLSDNPALTEAVAASEEVVPLFVVDDALWRPAGPNRRAFLAGCLRVLDADLGGRLVVRHGPPDVVIPALARDARASRVFATEDFGPYGRERDARVRAAGIDLTLVGSPYAVSPGEVRNRSGAPYQVFTPFFRAWQEHGWPDPIPAPVAPPWAGNFRSDGIPDPAASAAALPDPGEGAARARADGFRRTRLADYDTMRDFAGADGSSRLSPYLKWGCIHPRQLLAHLGASKADQRFRMELCWRDFYADVLFNQPASARQALTASMRTITVDTGAAADRRFQAWTEGRTGYPFVDAGMLQLRAEGWMHNRARMAAASFLVKDLHIDWRRGARWFLRHLVDGDLASNNHGWQWVAGTGTDPSPYVRVFNPVTQSKRFDPDGTYVRRYLPELAALDNDAIHEPWKLPGGPPGGYPFPIVDHAAERAEALRRYHRR